MQISLMSQRCGCEKFIQKPVFVLLLNMIMFHLVHQLLPLLDQTSHRHISRHKEQVMIHKQEFRYLVLVTSSPE